MQKSPAQKQIPSLRQPSVTYSECTDMQFKKTKIIMHLINTRLPRRQVRKQNIVDTPQRAIQKTSNYSYFLLRGADKEINRNDGEKKKNNTKTSRAKNIPRPESPSTECTLLSMYASKLKNYQQTPEDVSL